MIDPFGRAVSYLRVSVTDRCDFRCTYCMAENMTFLPKKDLLTLEELDRLCTVFVDKGVRKIRLTGGEPLVRKNIMQLDPSGLSRHIDAGRMDEVTLTTNGSQLTRFASELFDCGVRRINVSIDTLDPDKFRQDHPLGRARQGARRCVPQPRLRAQDQDQRRGAQGFQRYAEIPEMMKWAHGQGMDMTVIETMPMGEIDEDRTDQYMPLSLLRSESRTAVHPRGHPVPHRRPRALCHM
jgi:cyclic pyranopterin phosphate synthase